MVVTSPFSGEYLGSFFKRNSFLVGREFSTKDFDVIVVGEGCYEYGEGVEIIHAHLEELIEHHTLMPVARKIGLRALCGFPLMSRFNFFICPACVFEDYQVIGTPIIHLKHMVGRVTHCGKHGLMLLAKCPACHVNVARHNLPKLLKCMELEYPSIVEDFSEVGSAYSKFVQDMLELDCPEVLSTEARGIIRAKLSTLGYSVVGGVDMQRIAAVITRDYPQFQNLKSTWKNNDMDYYLILIFFAYGSARLYLDDLGNLRGRLKIPQFPSQSWRDYLRYLS